MPRGFKMTQLIPYEGKYDPKAFIMNFEVVNQFIRGNDAMMAKSLVMSVMEIAWMWYTTLEPRGTFSWEQLKEALLKNF